MLKICGLINYLVALHFWGITRGDCFFFNQLFTTLESNLACIFFFNNLFLVYNKQYVVLNYNNFYINITNTINQNLLNGSMNIHPIFFLILINFILIRYFRMHGHNKKYLNKEIFFFLIFIYILAVFFLCFWGYIEQAKNFYGVCDGPGIWLRFFY